MGRYLSFSDIFSDIFSDTVPEKDKRETVIAHMKICSDFGLSADRIPEYGSERIYVIPT